MSILLCYSCTFYNTFYSLAIMDIRVAKHYMLSENLIVMQGLPETENAANNLHQKALAFVYTEKNKK